MKQNFLRLIKCFFLAFLVYAVLFSNIAFSCSACLLNLSVALFDDSFRTWMAVFILLSQFSQMYHAVCWSIISILRYLYIVKNEWLFDKFPEQKKLKVWITFFELHFFSWLPLIQTFNVHNCFYQFNLTFFKDNEDC